MIRIIYDLNVFKRYDLNYITFYLQNYTLFLLNILQLSLAGGSSFQNLPSPTNISHFLTTLLKLGDLHTVMNYIEGWILEAERGRHEVSIIKNTFCELGRELQSSEMHIFLACWTLWDIEGAPRVIDFLHRTPTIKSFLLLLSAKYLGTIYFVSDIIENFLLIQILIKQ
jgi:hypothetical protein